MILSSFSHYSILHMLANMYVLWTFSSGIVSLLGKEQFLAVYMSAGGSDNELYDFLINNLIVTGVLITFHLTFPPKNLLWLNGCDLLC